MAAAPFFNDGTVTIWNADALALPLPDASVDLVVTSPPYFGLRSYKDDGEHYHGQIGSEASVREFLDALVAATAEMVRVLKPTGSVFVNLGDRYDPNKSLMGLPWRYALRCLDDLGLILRAEVVWSKVNATPEPVTDRVRRSHEQLFHFTKQSRYFSDTDEVREEYLSASDPRWRRATSSSNPHRNDGGMAMWRDGKEPNPLGRVPGSVWEIPTQPLQVPGHLPQHFAAFPVELPRRIIRGWCPLGGVTLDPFGGTGTTALAARALGRRVHHVDLSRDYCRLAEWRVTDLGEVSRAMRVEKPPPVPDGMESLLDLLGEPA